MHNSVLSAHLGVKRTKDKITQHYYWFNLKQYLKWYMKRCDICAADKISAKPTKAPIGNIKNGAPWDILAMNYLGPFSRTPRENIYKKYTKQIYIGHDRSLHKIYRSTRSP
jgi:hypothetical protein